jgi:uncharacterized protein (TIGR02453 family)
VFSGFPPDALAFFRELTDNNSKDWWHANKARYEAHVRGPFELLLDALFDDWGEAKLFRANRDTRFSKDKSPYKTQIAALVGGHYVQLSADGLLAGGGMPHLSKDQLQRYRAALDEPRRAARLVDAVERARAEGLELWGETLQTAPRGWSPDHPQIALLRHKELLCGRSWPVEPWLHTDEAVRRVDGCWRAVDPLVRWLQEEVGPPTGR